MPSKFQIWVDDQHLDNVMSYSAFNGDSQRTAGFTGGSPASSIRVNTALRQANLIACALMNIVDPNGTTDFRSNVSSIQTLIDNYLKTTLKVTNSTNADNATNANVTNLNTNSNAVVNFKIGNGTAYNKTINNVANVTTSLNGKNLSTIFESDGITVKNATNASTANIATYASSDTSKGTIDERLKNIKMKIAWTAPLDPYGNNEVSTKGGTKTLTVPSFNELSDVFILEWDVIKYDGHGIGMSSKVMPMFTVIDAGTTNTYNTVAYMEDGTAVVLHFIYDRVTPSNISSNPTTTAVIKATTSSSNEYHAWLNRIFKYTF